MTISIHGFEGFERYKDTAELKAKYPNATSMALETTDTPFEEGQAAYANEAENYGPLGVLAFDGTLPKPFVTMRFKLSGAALSDSYIRVLHFNHSTSFVGSAFSLNYDASTGTLLAYDDSDVLVGSASIDFTDGGYHSIEAYVFGDTSAGTVRVYVDDDLIMDLAGIDTKSTVDIGYFLVMSDVAGTYLDDLVWGAWTDDADRLGGGGAAWQEIPATVDGDSGTNQWTPNSGAVHYDRVNEFPPDDATSYLSSSAAGQTDEWDLAALSGVSSILAASVSIRGSADDAGVARSVTLSIDSNGSVFDFGSFVFTGTAWVRKEATYSFTDPDTGLAWTPAGWGAATMKIAT